jgi:alkaline phosphatase/streptomycin-6-phosphatase
MHPATRFNLKTLSTLVLVSNLAATAAMADFAEQSWSPDSREHARNVILLIGDGMGDSEITIARNYALGAAGRLALDTLPMTGAYTTYSLQESDPTKPDYVPDSASAGTAWATGSKTSNGRISTTAGTDQDLTTLLELAQRRGLRTGVVSTADITDATPAVQFAHVAARGCQGPANMAACPQDAKSAGGPGSIAEQAVDHRVDVLLGGGKSRFDQTIPAGPYAGQTVLQSAIAQGYSVVTDSAGLAAAQPGKMLLGLFKSGNMSLEWDGVVSAPHPGSGPQRCVENQRPANEPALVEMTEKAIALLDKASADRGFFLQVEGASIDKRDHAGNACQQIGETVAFDKAVKAALAFAKTHPQTLVVVTADHAHTSQIIPTDAVPAGFSTTLITADNAEMRVNYATGAASASSQEHTGSQVRIAAVGPQASRVLGVTDQTGLFHTVARALGIE